MALQASPFPFLELVESLKSMKRSGWVRHVPGPVESVASHMYRVAIMCQMADGVQLKRFCVPIYPLTLASSMKKHGQKPSTWH